ncbi:hypothetical protein X777_16878 [Ooceraea biroi]|uniref:Uncharacterized protein n=1 Tax=Ooceraea biroi TaxID=2015173 RepID=A0A026WUY7_OOCBI|nr:hypothetical protein X777_16878 [Ooceraea biroi]
MRVGYNENERDETSPGLGENFDRHGIQHSASHSRTFGGSRWTEGREEEAHISGGAKCGRQSAELFIFIYARQLTLARASFCKYRVMRCIFADENEPTTESPPLLGKIVDGAARGGSQ